MRSTRQLKASNPEVKARLRSVVIKYSIVFGIALAYLIFFLCTHKGIPCVFRKITGLKCVGCGVSKMLVAILRFDFATAFLYNPFLFITGPLLVAYLAACEVKYIRHGNRDMGRWEIFLWVELVLGLAFGILRNIF